MDYTKDKELLDAYLRGELSLAASTSLKERLSNDSSLQQQLQELQDIQEGIRFARLEEIQQAIQGWEQELGVQENEFEKEVSTMIHLEKNRELLKEIRGFEGEKQIPKTSSIKPSWWAVAASIVLLIGISWFWVEQSKPTFQEELFIAYFEPYPAIGIQRGNNEQEDLKIHALNYYTNKDYKKAIPLFQQLYEQHNDTLSLFYCGIAQLGNQQFEASINRLESVRNQIPNLQSQANWYIFLAYIGKGDVNAAQQVATNFDLGKKEKTAGEILEKYKNH